MNWKKQISKFSGKMTKEKWLFLLLLGVFLMILSFPAPDTWVKGKKREQQTAAVEEKGAVPLWTEEGGSGSQEPEEGDFGSGAGSFDSGNSAGSSGSADGGDGAFLPASAPTSPNSYEAQLEARIRELLKSVEGVGKVDVMVVLKSSSEKVMRIDRSESSSTTKEQDASGGQREAADVQKSESTVLSGAGSGGGTSPIIEKELSPEISGIIISAEGGGSPAVQAEISEAMEALFGLPPHKIKVLKRVE